VYDDQDFGDRFEMYAVAEEVVANSKRTVVNSVGTVHYSTKSMCFTLIGGMALATVSHTGRSGTGCMVHVSHRHTYTLY
jgi:hypothetical protein